MIGYSVFPKLTRMGVFGCAVAILVEACGLLLPGLPGLANATELAAEQILDRIEGTISLAGNGSATIELVTENKRGQQRSNKLKIYRSKDANGTEKQLVEYLEPADVAGTKLLSVAQTGQDSQIWLFMPALGRERRIAGTEMQAKFMGTDFSYEEISSASTYKNDYRAERSKDEMLDSRKCYVLRLTPRRASDYGFIKMWIWQDEFIPLRIEFYGKDGRERKLLSNSDLTKNAKGKWEPSTIVMADVLAGTKTIVRILETSDASVPEDYFTVRYLRR